MTRPGELPHSEANEKMVLGCMLTSEDHLKAASENLSQTDFYFPNHRAIFSSLQEAHASAKAADIHLLSENLQKKGLFESVGGVGYLVTLAQYAGTSANIDEYINLVREKSILRKLIDIARNIEKIALREPSDIQSEIDSLQKELEGIKKNKLRPESLYGHLLVPTSESTIREELLQTSPGVRVGMMLGKVDLKLQGGAMTIVAGPTGHGKTLLKINMVLNYLALYPEKKAYFFSYEESRSAILSLFLNTYIGEDISDYNRESIKSYFRDGTPQYVYKEKQGFFIRQKEDFFKTLIDTGRLNIFYSDYPVEELSDAVRFLKDRSNIGLVGIDYMQMLRTTQKKTTQRQEELKEICLILKDLAIETGLPLLIGAQFNRTVVNEAKMSPVAIGEAGDIERAANMIIGLWNRNCDGLSEEGNKGKDGKIRPKESTIYLEILKGRETGIGHSAVLDLHGNAGKISNRSATNSASPFG